MAGQAVWGNAGDATNAYIVNPKRAKELYYESVLPTLVGKAGDADLDTVDMAFGGGKSRKAYIGNSSLIWNKSITTGNEERLTMVEARKGMAGSYGDAPTTSGSYDKYRHATMWVNQIDSKADPIPGRCSLKQVKDILDDPKGILQSGQKQWASEEIDHEFLRGIIMGASRNLLSTTAAGSLGITLPNTGAAGRIRSCWNFYTPNAGLATPSVTWATHETNIGTAVSSVTDDTTDRFDLGQHNILASLTTHLKFKRATFGGKSYRAVVFTDPWLLWRLVCTSNTAATDNYQYLMMMAAQRGMNNPAIDHMDPIVLDQILYVPVEQLRAYRMTVSGGYPVYGPSTTNNSMLTDPRDLFTTNTNKICLQIWCGAGAMLRATDKKMWSTARCLDTHKGNYDYALHWDDGFVRREYETKDGRTEMSNDSTMVAAFYDGGVEDAFAA